MPPPKPSPESQSHPLYGTDRQVVDGLLASDQPGDGQLVDLARLLNRYDGFPGAEDLRADLAKTLAHWGLSREELHRRTRALWEGGYRPGPIAAAEGQAVGSGFDTAAQETP
ncbi:DUF3288 family protein [Synechococcus sp. ATX 2A4]|uniref:DUF3288 family protein n=1 Tax=Synechococcus sp. ATX 2A4 TaxID=2823727 RepID=UPI0020CC3750|nr:DUF3288 family protein [Synechococcus sp. ATX 2A4]MCP9883877.1 DUF3288 family protein [Synechococcus sp. ATX 2A4]